MCSWWGKLHESKWEQQLCNRNKQSWLKWCIIGGDWGEVRTERVRSQWLQNPPQRRTRTPPTLLDFILLPHHGRFSQNSCGRQEEELRMFFKHVSSHYCVVSDQKRQIQRRPQTLKGKAVWWRKERIKGSLVILWRLSPELRGCSSFVQTTTLFLPQLIPLAAPFIALKSQGFVRNGGNHRGFF